MGSFRRTRLFLAAIPGLLLPAVPAGAQEHAAGSAPGHDAAAAVAWEDAFELHSGEQRLRLTWRLLPPGGETVRIGPAALQAGVDYTFAPDVGEIILRRPLTAAGVVTVRYAPTPYLSVSVADGREYLPGAGQRRAGPSLKQRLAGALHAEGGPVAIPPPVGAKPPDGPAGEGPFQGIASEAGLRVTDVGAGPAAGLPGTYRYTRLDPLDPGAVSSAREEFRASLGAPAGGSAAWRLETTMRREGLFDRNYEEAERSRLLYDLGPIGSRLSVSWDRERRLGPGGEEISNALTLALSRALGASTSAQGLLAYENSVLRGREGRSMLTVRQLLGNMIDANLSFGFRQSDWAGDQWNGGGILTIRPGLRAEANLSLHQASSQTHGRYLRYAADVTAALAPFLQVSAEASRRLTSRYGDLRQEGVGLALQPTARSILQAAFSQSVGSSAGRERSHVLRAAVSPSSSLQIEAGFDLLRGGGLGGASNASWLVQIGGERYLRLEGNQGLFDPRDAPAYRERRYAVEARPFGTLSALGSFREVKQGDERDAVAGVGALLSPARWLELGARYRRALVDGVPAETPAGHDLHVALQPLRGFRLFTREAIRPEDPRDAGLLDERRRTYGAETRFGSLSLLGGYTELEGGAGDNGRRTELLASLLLGGRTRIYGGVRVEESPLGDELRRRLYRLGIGHSGGDFYLLLEGRLAAREDTAGRLRVDPRDTRAHASLGLRF